MAGWPGSITAITLFVDDTMINLLESSATVSLIDPATVALPGTGSRLQLTLNVQSVDATCAELAGLGVVLLNSPMDREWGIHTGSFRNPGGHTWEIAQSLE